jgi:lipoprotein-anchoring transpeptidase ErfK/SrfK
MNLPRLGALAAFAALMVGCASGPSSSSTTRRTATRGYSEATLFLGSDGQVVTVPSTRAKARAAEASAYWHGDGVSGSPAITIDIAAQKAYFYKGGKLVGETPVCTGNAQNPTPRGNFSVIQKDIDHRSNLYGVYVDEATDVVVVQNVDVYVDKRPAGTKFVGAKMPYFLRFSGGSGLHAGYLPGFPDSHGCVRLPDEMARIYYENAPSGTPVRVH